MPFFSYNLLHQQRHFLTSQHTSSLASWTSFSCMNVMMQLGGRAEWQVGWGVHIGEEKHEDISSFRLVCAKFNSLVLARATRMELFGRKSVVDELELWPLPVRLLQTVPNLQLLDLRNFGKSPLSLAGLPSTITTLNLGGSTLKHPLLDLSPLSKCIGLKDLNISACRRVADLSALPACNNLERLVVFGCGTLTSLSPLANCTRLRILHLGFTEITDLCPLSACKELEMIDCSFSNVSDLSPLSACLRLEDVNCSDTHVSDISPLSACLKLRRVGCFGYILGRGIEVTHNYVRDITSLAACPQLIFIQCNKEVIGLELGKPPIGFRRPWYSHPAFPEVRFIVPNA